MASYAENVSIWWRHHETSSVSVGWCELPIYSSRLLHNTTTNCVANSWGAQHDTCSLDSYKRALDPGFACILKCCFMDYSCPAYTYKSHHKHTRCINCSQHGLPEIASGGLDHYNTPQGRTLKPHARDHINLFHYEIEGARIISCQMLQIIACSILSIEIFTYSILLQCNVMENRVQHMSYWNKPIIILWQMEALEFVIGIASATIRMSGEDLFTSNSWR